MFKLPNVAFKQVTAIQLIQHTYNDHTIRIIIFETNKSTCYVQCISLAKWREGLFNLKKVQEAAIVGQSVKTLPVTLASQMGASSRPCCSISLSAPC